MWVEFVVGSRPCSKGFFRVLQFFVPFQKPTFPNSNLIWNPRATGLSVENCLVSPLLSKVDLFIYYFYFFTRIFVMFLKTVTTGFLIASLFFSQVPKLVVRQHGVIYYNYQKLILIFLSYLNFVKAVRFKYHSP